MANAASLSASSVAQTYVFGDKPLRGHRLGTFNAYLLAVVAMDDDLEPFATIEPFMAARFGRRAYPLAIMRGLRELDRQGLVRTFLWVRRMQTDTFVRAKIYPQAWRTAQKRHWFQVTQRGIETLSAHPQGAA